jgi:4-diphosphocytidyl-2-C-methyl-D-erythritol kinase
LIVFPNCKLNLGLNILGKRPDGYHDLETVFYPVPLYDVLEIIQQTNTQRSFELFLSGIKIEGDKENNLCIRAYHLLKKDFPELPAVKIYLHKAIPAGAGLGGGSADGAFMLMLMNDKFNLDISQQQLINYARALGSDCPFFILNKPCFAQQRGEVLEPVQLNLSGYKLVIVNPCIHVDTGWAFTQVKYACGNDMKNIIQKPVEAWKNKLTNDFELPVFEKFPELKNIKDRLYMQGALYASMSGSGSTVYGIFEKNSRSNIDFFPSHYFIRELVLQLFKSY